MQKLFGTDGIRRKFGQSPFVPDDLVKLAKAIGNWIIQKQSNPTVAIGYDTRGSKDICFSSLKTGLLQFPLTIIDHEIIPTPLLQQSVQHNNYSAGIMITASHNAAEYNGIKIFTAKQKITPEDQKIIEYYYYNQTNTFDPLQIGMIKKAAKIKTWYSNFLTQHFKKTLLENKKIVFDCANGAFSDYVFDVMKDFKPNIILLSNSPDGFNINKNCGSLYPKKLIETVLEHHAEYGFAFDGDGDRVTMVDAHGTIFEGDELLCLLMNNKKYKNSNAIVGTILSNQGLEDYCINNNKNFLRTPVGDMHISKKMKDNGLSLGGEPSGHIITKETGYCSDGLFTALALVETFKNHKKEIKPYTLFGQSIKNITIKNKKEIDTKKTQSIIDQYQSIYPNNRFLIRYSGTEPVVRVMVEDKEEKKAELICTKLHEKLKPLFD